jgi:CMP-N-acetylneuraminic acid synthetase
MIHNKQILCVIPARGGSKGIPLKNMKKINGKTLIQLVVDCAKQVNLIDKIILSTDNEIIAKEGKDCGIDVPFYRPPELSGDRVSDFQVLEHVLKTLEKNDNNKYEYIVMLQPTSPLRTPKNVEDCIKKIENENWDSIWTISKNDSKNHPLKQLIKDDSDKLSLYDTQGSKIIARQELNSLFYRNGVAYVVTRDCLLNQKTIMGKNAGGYLINSYQISIDSLDDLELAEFYMNKKL